MGKIIKQIQLTPDEAIYLHGYTDTTITYSIFTEGKYMDKQIAPYTINENDEVDIEDGYGYFF